MNTRLRDTCQILTRVDLEGNTLLRVVPNRELGLVILDEISEPTDGPYDGDAVGLVDVVEGRAVLDGSARFDEVADRLETASVAVERRGEA